MSNAVAEAVTLLDPEMEMLSTNSEDGYNYQYRRYDDWRENYDLYRDKVQVNRLTQRQSVNIPLMKQTVRTLLKDVDDVPVLYFENLDNDKQAELFKNEYWEWTFEQNKMDLQDIVDKRQVFLFGRSFDQWQIVDGMVKMTVVDPIDIKVSRYCDPFNLHSSRYLIHDNIFVPLSSLKNNPDYDQDVIKELEMWYATEQGLIAANNNTNALIEKEQKLADIGVLDAFSPKLGETYVSLTLHFLYRDNEPVKDDQSGDPLLDENGNEQQYPTQIFLYTIAENIYKLNKKPLEKVIGETKDHYWRNHYPYVTWADDVERQDFWSDGVGDIVRGSNRILNVWYSQEVENRTLRSFGMNYYDATIEGFQPQTMQPMPFGWYGMPGDPSKVFQKVDIPQLEGNLDNMNFVLEINEKATGATSTQQGVETPTAVTLGEVQLALTEAKERVKGMSKFYTPAWKERGMMFIKLIEAAPEKLDAVRIYKKGKNTSDIFSREIDPTDWQTPLGYQVKVWSQDERNGENSNQLQKLNAVMLNMPGNPKLKEIYDRKLLEFADLTPEQVNDVMQFEEQRMQAINSMQGNGVEMPGMPQPAGGQPQPGKQLSPGVPQQPQIQAPQPQLPAQAGGGR